MYGIIKQIANAFRIKCDKYPKEQLTPEFCDTLFAEAVKETCAMNEINRVTNNALDAYKNASFGDRCVACGEYVPEGRHICVNCEAKFANVRTKE